MRSPDEDLRGVGHEPDYRFTLANERTFLAYIRTALAFFAAGTAILSFFDRIIDHRGLVVVIGSGLYALGLFTAAAATGAGVGSRWPSGEGNRCRSVWCPLSSPGP